MIWKIMSVVKSSCLWLSKWTWSITKIRKLIHIKPNTRKLYFFVKKIEHINPIIGSIRMKKINKRSSTWPNYACKFFTIGSFEENISFLSLSIRIKWITSFDSSINNWHIVVILKNLFHSIKWESFFIDGKILKVKHVINIAPYSVQRKVVLFVFL